MTGLEKLLDWVLDQKRKKTKAHQDCFNRSKTLTDFERKSMLKIHGKLQLLGEIETKIMKLQKQEKEKAIK